MISHPTFSYLKLIKTLMTLLSLFIIIATNSYFRFPQNESLKQKNLLKRESWMMRKRHLVNLLRSTLMSFSDTINNSKVKCNIVKCLIEFNFTRGC